jgi:aldose 1-epimerase
VDESSARAPTPIEYTELENRNGIRVRLTNFGARILELWCPDRFGEPGDVVLGFDTDGDYVRHPGLYLGCTIGRVANRISGARFTIDGTTYELAANDGRNHLHGGAVRSFDKRVWELEEPASTNAVRYTLVSPHLDEGYPGALRVQVSFTLTEEDELVVEYRATTTLATPINLTNHTYWNLGSGRRVPGDVLRHDLWIGASRYTPVDEELIPTGEFRPVDGTPLDFRQPTVIGARVSGVLGSTSRGYDHNLVLDSPAARGSAPATVARLREPKSARVVEVLSTQPAIQLYGGQMLPRIRGKREAWLGPNAGVCLEPQGFPNAVNVAAFPSIVVQPSEEYHETQIFRFGVDA